MAAQDKVTFKQDLTEPVKIRHYDGVVFTGDDCGNLIKVALFDGGVPYSGGGTVSATAVLADGTTFPLTQGSITGNMVSVPLEAGALVVSGLMGLYVKISGGSIICTVLNAIFTVQATDTGRMPTATVTTVNELVAAIRDAQDSFPADLTNLLAAVAPTFSTSTAYSAGAYVWQGGKLYRFTAAHPAGTWTGTDAVAVALGNDVADLKSAIDYSPEIIWNMGAISSAQGTETDSSTRIRTGYTDCRTVEVQSGYKYIIAAYNGEMYIGMWNGSDFVKSATWLTTNTTIPTNTGYKYRLVLARANDASIETTDGVNLICYAYTDTTLIFPGAAADAKAVGDQLGYLRSASSDIISGVNISKTGIIKNRSWYFQANIIKGNQYVFGNNTDGTCTLNCIKKDGTAVLIKEPVNAGASYTWTATDNYAQFGGWFNGDGGITLTGNGGVDELPTLRDDMAQAQADIAENAYAINANGLVHGVAWANRIYYYADNAWGNTSTRTGTQSTIYAMQNMEIVVDAGYKISVMYFTGETPSADNKKSTTQWVQSAKVQKGDYFLINMRNDPDSGNISPEASSAHIHYLVNTGSVVDYSRTYIGEKFPSKRHGFNISNYMTIAYDSSLTLNDTDYYNGNIYCAINPGHLRVYDLASKILLHDIAADVSHGNVLQISKEFVNETDPVPLIYTGWDGNANVIRVNSNWAASVTKQIAFDAEYGYMTSAVFDFDRGVAYVFGYAQNNHTSSNGNYIILTVADIKNMTVAENNTYTPTVLNRKNIPWFGTMQGGKYYNNRIYFVTAGTSSPYSPKIVGLSTGGNIVSEITDFPDSMQVELESLFFTETGEEINMFVSTFFTFYKYDFE